MAGRLWKSGSELVVERGPSATTVVSSLFEEVPVGPFRALQEYARVDGEGRVHHHRVLVWSVDEELGVEAFAVVGGELQSLTVNTHSGAKYHVERRTQVLLTGLRELLPVEEFDSLKGFGVERPEDAVQRAEYEEALARLAQFMKT